MFYIDSTLELVDWRLTMCHTYEPFNQVRYKEHLAQIHSIGNDINISYVDNGYANNIFVKENELEPIVLTSELLDKLIGNRKTSSDDFIVRFNCKDYTVRVGFEANGSWIVSVNGENHKRVKYLHELQNYIKDNANKHIIFLVENSNTLAI